MNIIEIKEKLKVDELRFYLDKSSWYTDHVRKINKVFCSVSYLEPVTIEMSVKHRILNVEIDYRTLQLIKENKNIDTLVLKRKTATVDSYWRIGFSNYKIITEEQETKDKIKKRSGKMYTKRELDQMLKDAYS